jgi:subtilisin-like proprotein convertase family protein
MKKLTFLLLLSCHFLSVNAQNTIYQIWGDSIVCAQDTAFLFVQNLQNWSRNDTFSLPDGTGLGVNDSILISGFPMDATITNAQQIAAICFDIEHSWIRDLEIKLTCPNLQSIVLHNFGGQTGMETFLGIANDSDQFDPIFGTPFTYCFQNEPTYNFTWLQFANNFEPSVLPAGSYRPFEGFQGLVGCPLNGNWQLKVIDLWPIDNGYLANFALSLTVNNDANPLTYLWSNGDTTQYTNAANNGEMSVIVSDLTGVIAENSVNVQVLPSFNLEIDTVLTLGNSLGFVDGTSITAAGIFTSNNSSVLGCDSSTVWNVSLVSPIDDLWKENNFKVYPNPSNGAVYLRANDAIQSVKIYDNLGNLVAKITDFSFKNNENEVDLRLSLSEGLYHVVVQTGISSQFGSLMVLKLF